MRKLLFAIIIALMPLSANAQWALGGGLELREEDPESGFNVRLENELSFDLPFLKFRTRLQGGFFSEDFIEISEQDGGTDDIEFDVSSYYIGANLLGEVSTPLPVNPYAGVGVGFENLSTDEDALEQATNGDDSNGSAYIDATLGLKISIIPKVKPFAEYRYVEPFGDFDILRENATSLKSNNRFVFGALVQF